MSQRLAGLSRDAEYKRVVHWLVPHSLSYTVQEPNQWEFYYGYSLWQALASQLYPQFNSIIAVCFLTPPLPSFKFDPCIMDYWVWTLHLFQKVFVAYILLKGEVLEMSAHLETVFSWLPNSNSPLSDLGSQLGASDFFHVVHHNWVGDWAVEGTWDIPN